MGACDRGHRTVRSTPLRHKMAATNGAVRTRTTPSGSKNMHETLQNEKSIHPRPSESISVDEAIGASHHLVLLLRLATTPSHAMLVAQSHAHIIFYLPLFSVYRQTGLWKIPAHGSIFGWSLLFSRCHGNHLVVVLVGCAQDGVGLDGVASCKHYLLCLCWAVTRDRCFG